MTAPTPNDRFREALESAVEDALAKLPQEVVTALWNALDDERGRLTEENHDLRAKLDRLNAAANRALDNLNAFIADTSDPGVEALGARHELWASLDKRIPSLLEGDFDSDSAADRRHRIYVDGEGQAWVSVATGAQGGEYVAQLDAAALGQGELADWVQARTGSLREIGRTW